MSSEQHDQDAFGLRLRRDTNRDGFEELTAEYGRDGRLRRVTLDHDRDGRSELQGIYQSGSLIEVVHETEVDSDGDGRPDRWERYKNGLLVVIRSDNDGDGRPDQWERLDAGGRLNQLEYDTDGDGVPDLAYDPDSETAR